MTNIKNWLKEKMVSSEAYDANGLLNKFLSEMDAGLTGDDSLLADVPSGK